MILGTSHGAVPRACWRGIAFGRRRLVPVRTKCRDDSIEPKCPVEILPLHETLHKNVGDQFSYRYNCDEHTVIAAVVQFHRGLWFTSFASSDQRIIELFNKPEFLQLPASVMVRPGNLLGLLPSLPTA